MVTSVILELLVYPVIYEFLHMKGLDKSDTRTSIAAGVFHTGDGRTIRQEEDAMRKAGYLFVLAVCAAFLALSWSSIAGEKGHGSMSGMHPESKMEGHGMMKMGDKVFEGKIGPWNAEGRLVDMKAQMAKANVSKEMMAGMKHTHHLSVLLKDGEGREVTEGKGTVTVTGPGKTRTEYDLSGMQGHFGADVNLDKPGKYDFSVTVEADGKEGNAGFSHTVR